jgi:beta-lactamase regulating signal transducer with metallopeptidase domain
VDAVLNWIWQGCVVAIAAAGALRLMESSRAELRYRAVWLALGCILMLPVVPLLWALATPAPIAVAGAAASTAIPRDPVVSIPATWWTSGIVMLVLWGAWSAIFGARIAAAGVALRRARQECRATPAGFEGRLRRWSHVRTSGRPARMVVSGSVRAAAVLGGRPPIIALSPVLLDHLSDDELDRVVIHEWAHIQRRDDLAHALQLAVRLLAGWHPAVWWCDRQLRIEREIACDEMALTLTGSVKAYAACLAKLASLPRSSLPPLPVVSVLSSGLRGRIVRILSFDRVTRSRGQVSAAIVASIGLGLTAFVVGGFPVIGITSVYAQATSPGAAPVVASLASRDAVASAHIARPALAPARGKAAPPAQQPTAGNGDRREVVSAPDVAPPAVAETVPSSRELPAPLLASGTVAVPSSAELMMPIADAQASRGQIQRAPSPDDEQPVRPWTAAADTGVAIGRGSQNAAVATAGFFNRLGRKIGNSF